MCDWENSTSELERISATQPTAVDVECQLGDHYGRLGLMERSKEHFRKAAAVKGGDSALRWKHLSVTSVFHETADEIDEYWRVLNVGLDEAIAEGTRYDWRSLPFEGAIPPFPIAHYGRCCREIREKFARIYDPSFEEFCAATEKKRSPGKKIRIGYFLLPMEEGVFVRSMAGIINRLDPERFEQYLLCLPGATDLIEKAHKAVKVSLPRIFEKAVESIRNLNLDAIYYRNVGSLGWSYFLPRLRLAPVQVASWGDLGTTGVSDVDYYLSHKLTESANAQEHYTEQLVLLNNAPRFEPFEDRDHSTATRAELGLPESGALYFCPHRLAKYHPDFDLYIKGVLESDSNGYVILMLRNPECADSAKVKERITRRVGATLAKRLIFITRTAPKDYGKYYSVTSALLDSCVYSGCLTLYDAMAHGVPCVSQVGDLCVQRFPVGAYAAMGIESPPIANNREEYVRLAVEVGTNSDYRRSLSEQIIERRDEIFEREEAAREFEEFWELATRP